MARLQFLLRDLVADGYFELGERKATKDAVELDVTLGSRSVAKSWDRIAAFDSLADRVRSDALMARRSKPSASQAKSSAHLLPPTWNEGTPLPELDPIDLSSAKF